VMRSLGRATLFQTAVALGSVALGSAALGCGGSKSGFATALPDAASHVGVLEFLPFEDNTVASFQSKTDLGEETLIVMEFARPHPEQGEIWIAGHRQSFHLSPKAVERAAGGFLLHAPLEVGSEFQGPFGHVVVLGVGEKVTVPAGSFRSCVRTDETSERPPKSVETTYCRGVGIVKITVSGDGGDELASVESVLTSYGPRMDLGQAH
jgi:hypothetical protein